MCGTGDYSIADLKEHHTVSGAVAEFHKVNKSLLSSLITKRSCFWEAERERVYFGIVQMYNKNSTKMTIVAR